MHHGTSKICYLNGRVLSSKNLRLYKSQLQKSSLFVCIYKNLYDRDLNVISSSFSDSIDMTFRRFLAVGEIPGRHYPRTIYMYLCPRRSVRNSLNCQLKVDTWSSKWRQKERLPAIYLSTFIFVVSL